MILSVFLLTVAGLQGQEPASRERIDPLVRDLGSSDEKTRESADRELRRIGREAVPELREAARSRDAEQALRARRILTAIRSQDHPSKRDDSAGGPTPNIRRSITCHDWTNGVYFHLRPDGKVILRAPVPDEKTGRREYRTWRADSLEEFRKKYPDVAKQVDLDKLLKPTETPAEDREWWAELEEWLGPTGILGEWPGGWSLPGDDRGARRGGAPEPEGPRLGVHVSRVPPGMRERFKLEDEEGILVRQVEARSLARKAGIQPYDILLTVDGKPVKNPDQLRDEVRSALKAGKDFTVEVLRGGDRKSLTVPAATQGSELK